MDSQLAAGLGSTADALERAHDDRVHNARIEDELIDGRLEDEDAYWPALRRRLPDGRRLLVSHGLDQAEALLDFTQGTMAAILAVSIALALGLALLQGRALLARIDALIDTARAIDTGRLNRRVSLSGNGGELDELAELYSAQAEEQGRTLELTVPRGCIVTGNRHLLAQAIGNLLDNALKFSPPGTPLRLEVSAANDHVRVVVSDPGPGIPAEEREHVLKRFVRLDAARSTPGSGLGLSLVAAVARLHGAGLTLGGAGPGLMVTLKFHRSAAA